MRIAAVTTVLVLAATGAAALLTPGARTGHAGSATAAPAVQLVEYTGTQPVGFRIAKVPEGFDLKLQASTPAVLVVAKVGDTSPPSSFVNKIVIEATQPRPHELSNAGFVVKINGSIGTVTHTRDTTTLAFDAHYVRVAVQCWNSIGLTDQQLVEFSDGVTVTQHVQISHG